jgi:hypothetical protein
MLMPTITFEVSADVWNGTADTAWYTANPAATSFTIDTAEELAGLASLVNAGTDTFSGNTVTLGANIILNDTSNFSNWGATSPANIFPVIGITISDPNGNFFQGTFDGDGHSITGLYVNNSSRNYVGLFDTLTSTSTVKNLILNSCYISGYESVGGIAGYSAGTISGCSVSGVVKGSEYMVGGITGNSAGTISGCANFANISGVHKVGGITGTLSASTAIIYDCYNTGSISGSGVQDSDNFSDTGGILGDDADSTTANCYNLGNVSGTNGVGGIGGFISGTVTNCYSVGSVTGTANFGGIVGSFLGTVSYSYWNSDKFSGGGTGDTGTLTDCASKTTTEMKATNFVTLLNTNKGTYSSWKAVTNGYPTFGTPVTTYTVTFDSKGGSAVSPLTNIASGSTIAEPTEPTPPADKSDFTFWGWYTSETDYKKETKWNFATNTVTSNITLYAC